MASTAEQSGGTLQRIIDAGLILILLAAPTQYSFEVAEGVYLSIVDPMIWIVFALWGIDVLRTRAIRSVRLPPLTIILFIAMGFLSIMRAMQVMASLKDLFQLVEYFIAGYLLFYHRARSPQHLRRMLAVFVGVAALIVLGGVVQYFNGSIDDFDVRGSFGNRNVYGGFLAIILPLCFGLALYDSRLWVRIGCVVVVLAGLVTTLSGGSLVAIMIALLALAIMRHVTVFIACAAVLCTGIVFVLPELPRMNNDILFESIALYPNGYDVGTRYTEWQAAVVMTEENPLLGVGIGNYQANIGQYYGTLPSPAVKLEDDSQNMYLVIASTMGLPGLALFIAILAGHARAALQLYFRSNDPLQQGLCLGLAGALFAFALNCLWTPLLVRGIGVPLAFLLALIAAMGAPVASPAGKRAE